MTDLYDIEEVFPGEVNLPRRQAGSSPQGLAMTLLADYTLRNRAWLPSAALVVLLGDAGVSRAGARAAISRLSRRGVLEGSRRGRHSAYRLTADAAASLSNGGRWIMAWMTRAPEWDGRWTLIAFSLPQEGGTQRRALRGQLRWLGYAPLYDGLWVSPQPFSEKAQNRLAKLTLGAATVFHARQVELSTMVGRDPLDAWDTEVIAGHYEAFLARWRPLLPRIAAGEVHGAEAVRARTEVMDTFRQFPLLDPQLPMRLLPAGWLRGPAATVFTDVYDGLAGPACEHVRTVAAGHFAGPTPGIAAHSAAELLTGVPPGPGADRITR